MALSHALLLLSAHWSVRLRAALRFRRTSSVAAADVVLVEPAAFAGMPALVSLQQRGNERFFEFRKQAFVWEEHSACSERAHEARAFRRRRFPRLSFAEYAGSRGLSTMQQVAAVEELYGSNNFNLPLPKWRELLKEQMLAPFFCFQVLCCILWSLDDMWQTSMFTLLMLIIFECTVVATRLRTARELRSQGAPRQAVLTLRGGAWTLLQPDALLPGDVVSIGRPSGAAADRIVVPADLLLLSGSCIATEALLTGESAPQWKSAAPSAGDEVLSMKRHRQHVVFGGTKVVQHTEGRLPGAPRPTDGGCVAVVLRTGFGTEQGKLFRTIMFSTESVSANSREAFAFIGILLCFAVAAAAHVLHVGLADPRRSRWKLFLHASMVLTSVIPPELPMELTIAVNSSLIALSRLGIFCTEPFRIPMAGALGVVAFDKTGTLTRDELRFQGVCTGADEEAGLQPHAQAVPPAAELVLGGCHSLVRVDGALAGDPLEMAALAGLGWSYNGGDVVTPARTPGASRPGVRILRRLHFSPELRRMATVVRHEGGDSAAWVLCKGAPEAVMPLCTPDSLPPRCEDVYRRWAAAGMRVLALASRPLSIEQAAPPALRAAERDHLEAGLSFVGFALFACPTREDSGAAIAALRHARHAALMLTGDAPLTACHVARETRIATRPLLLLSPTSDTADAFHWTTPTGETVEPFEVARLAALSGSYDLCVSGDGLAFADRTGGLHALVRHTQVYARCAPHQKEAVIKALRAAGLSALMCGDGTNDVGALKAAAVGVALVAAPPASYDTKRKAASTHDELPLVRLGDASMAAPFTAKMPSITSCVHVVKQGRAALTTTVQMFKILGINCLVSAFALSVQYLDGVKWGDTQATVAGIFTAALFMMLALAKPAPRLARARPHTSVFCAYALTSIAAQFAAHLALLWRAVQVAKAHAGADASSSERHPDDDFAPGLVNTAAFLASMASQLSTFAVNYVGAPFSTPLTQNKPLLWSLVCGFGGLALLAANAAPPLAAALELVHLPPALQELLLLGAVVDYVVCLAAERSLRAALPERPAAAALALSPGM